MTATELLKVLQEADYKELIKAVFMYETGVHEDEAARVYEDYMNDDDAHSIFDLSKFL